MLRVYSGVTRLSEILATGRGSPARLDVVLEPGNNRLVVTDADGKLAVAPADGDR